MRPAFGSAALLAAACIVVVTPTSAGATVARCHGVVATIVGTDGSDQLSGTGGRDVIAALGGDDFVFGRAGNDLICGGAGSDHLLGGWGTDTIYGGLDHVRTTDEGSTERTGDTITGGPGNDRLVPGHDGRHADEVTRDTVSWDNASQAVHIDLATGVATGAGRDQIVGGPVSVIGSMHSDVIIGSSHSDRIYAGDGSDVVHAKGGDDVVNADGGRHRQHADDQIFGGSGDDQLTSAQGDDVMRGGSGNDVLDDYAATADRLYGGPGGDLIVTELVVTTKPQVIAGGPGLDRVNLMTHHLNATAQAGPGTWNMASGLLRLTLDSVVTATVSGFEDADLSSYGLSWSVTGTEARDILRATGTTGTTFTALGGDDQFMGSSSDDTFDGGLGNDRSLGMGSGDDTCVSVELFDYPDCEHNS